MHTFEHNIAHVEFKEGNDRNQVVRFYDHTGLITKRSLEFKRIRFKIEIAEMFLERLQMSSFWWKRFEGWRRRLQRKAETLKAQIKAVSIEEMQRTLANSRGAAIEQTGRKFRALGKNELSTILSNADGYRTIWVWVFKPNDLMSPTNIIVAHML